ncbi:MAG: PFL family protein [Ruminococcaceae bacterium]|nr:PFL family protein [Oscillospiraceae bacterium]
MINSNEILETINMVKQEHFDVRTITMGISLLGCIKETSQKTADAVYDIICKRAENIVKVGEELSQMYGVPIVNKRISITPASMLTSNFIGEEIVLARALDKAAKTVGVDFLGGYSALVHKSMTESEKSFINSIPEVLATTDKLCSSVNVGSTRSGINLDAIKLLGEIIKKTAELTSDRDGFGCAKFVAFCNAVEDNPFMAGAFHGVGEGDTVINVGVSGPGVVHRALKNVPSADITEVAEIIKKTAFKITRVGQLIATEAAKRLNAEFGIVDLSLAPTPVVGDSVGHVLEEMGIETVGGHGTTAALAILNDAVKKGGTMASSRVGGLSGAFIPVSEDIGMIESAEKGILTLSKLEAMTAVCSVGIDMVAVPGNTDASTISAMIADEMAIGMVNSKTTAVRVIPVPGKDVGDSVEFGGLLGTAPIMPVINSSAQKFISRGGKIPAPIHGNKN